MDPSSTSAVTSSTTIQSTVETNSIQNNTGTANIVNVVPTSSPTTTNTNDTTNTETNTNSMVANVAEIFHFAGFAFKRMGELVVQLEPPNDDNTASSQQHETHWQPSDVERFRSIVKNFSEELTSLTNSLKNRMATGLKEEHMNNITKTLPASDKSLLAKADKNNPIKVEPSA